MKGIVRGINVSAGKFFVDCGHDRYAVFQVCQGVIPRPGENVRWNDEFGASVTMVMGESSGSIRVNGVLFPVTRDAATELLQQGTPPAG